MLEAQTTEIQKIETETSPIIKQAMDMKIADDAGVGSASVVLKNISEMKKGIEERRKFFVAPLNDQVKKINELFKDIVFPLEEADKMIRGKVSTYRSEQAEIARKEQERLNREAAERQKALDAEAKALNVEPVKVAAPVVAPPPKSIGNVQTRKVWKFEITNRSVVPAEYLVVDEVKVRQAVMSGAREIPGVRIYEEETIVVR